MLTSTELRDGMAPLLRHWPDGRRLPDQAKRDYHLVLRNFDGGLMLLAALEVLQTYVYPTFPKPATIYEAGVRALMERDGYSERWARDVLGDVSTVLDKLELEAQARISPPAPTRGGGEGSRG